jgi:hypothetical protein
MGHGSTEVAEGAWNTEATRKRRGSDRPSIGPRAKEGGARLQVVPFTVIVAPELVVEALLKMSTPPASRQVTEAFAE